MHDRKPGWHRQVLGGGASHLLHLLGETALGVAGLVAVAGCVLAWRLSQGPIDITGLVARHLTEIGGIRVTVGQADLAWEGFFDPDSPLDIRWRDLTADTRDGTRLAVLPQGRIFLSPFHLLLGQAVPRSIDVVGAQLQFRREKDGQLDVALGGNQTRRGGGPALLHALTTAPGRPGSLPALAQLRHIRVEKSSLDVADTETGTAWQARSVSIDLRREANGTGIAGTVFADLGLNGQDARLSGNAELTPGGTHLVLATTPVSPAALAGLNPSLGALAAVNLPVSLALDSTLDPELRLSAATIRVHAGQGTVQAGKGSVPIASADATLSRAGVALELKDLRVALAGAPGAQAPVLTGHALATMDTSDAVRAEFAVAVDRVTFADLPKYWPPGTGGGARPWISKNITAGVAERAHVEGRVETGPGLKDVRLTSLSGGVSGRGLTVNWLRPVPPLERANAELTVDGPDVLHIDVAQASQGTLTASGGSFRISGLIHKDQIGDLDMRMSGGLAETLALLNHPRLRLLSKRPFPVTNPAGEVAAHLSMRIPLDAKVTMDEIGVHATADLTHVHLGGVAGGRDLDDGTLSLDVNADGLKISGTASLAGIPSSLLLAMDFRDGPPAQILEHVEASGTANAAQLAGVGLPAGIVTEGSAALAVVYDDHRDGKALLSVQADLGKASLSTPVWSKPAGPAASASGRLILDQERLVGVDRLLASGPSLSVVSRFESAPGGHGGTLRLERVRLGRTDAQGSVEFPGQAAAAVRISLKGTVLDLSGLLARQKTAASSTPPDDTAKPGPRWAASLSFGRLQLNPDESFEGFTAAAEDDGVKIVRASVSAGRGTKTIRGAITPVAGGRTLSVDAPDAGAVLLAAGVSDRIQRGRLVVQGRYDDRTVPAPLTGTATLQDFRVANAPGLGRVLEAATLYGAVDLLRGPGLGFRKAVVPFRWQHQVLTLENGTHAFSSSLGLTAAGTFDMRHQQADLTGTVVPAYFFNQLLGNLPVLGRLFSPEKGGGVFAVRYTLRGPLAHPQVKVNPLSALTPGLLRELFGAS